MLVRAVAVGEADLVVTFFTRTDGKLSAMVRGARRSQKRFGGALEPIHGLAVRLADRGREMCTLEEARLERPRTTLTSDLARMDVAGHALRWVRHLCPPRTPEPGVWAELVALLDALDRLDAGMPPEGHLAAFGLRLLAEMGYALDLGACVRCGKPCPPGRPAFVDAARGGLVCMACGGARRAISGDLREAAVTLVTGGPVLLAAAAASELVELVEEAMAAHASFDATGHGGEGGDGGRGGPRPR